MDYTKTDLKTLLKTLPQQGSVQWLGIRLARRQPLQKLEEVVVTKQGLQDDHYAGSSGKRSITLIQYEHLDTIASLLHVESVDPANLRRNIVVKGINLLALKNREFSIGAVVLKMTGLCHPCSRMEETFGKGGYNAVRGHGGINASVIKPGIIALNDVVSAIV